MSEPSTTAATKVNRLVARIPLPIRILLTVWLAASLVFGFIPEKLVQNLPDILRLFLHFPHDLIKIALPLVLFWQGLKTILRTFQSIMGPKRHSPQFLETENQFGAIGALLIVMSVLLLVVSLIREQEINDFYGVAFSSLLSVAFGCALAFGKPHPKDVTGFLWWSIAVSVGAALLIVLTGTPQS
jgi:hypothetical protein